MENQRCNQVYRKGHIHPQISGFTRPDITTTNEKDNPYHDSRAFGYIRPSV